MEREAERETVRDWLEERKVDSVEFSPYMLSLNLGGALLWYKDGVWHWHEADCAIPVGGKAHLYSLIDTRLRC